MDHILRFMNPVLNVMDRVFEPLADFIDNRTTLFKSTAREQGNGAAGADDSETDESEKDSG